MFTGLVAATSVALRLASGMKLAAQWGGVPAAARGLAPAHGHHRAAMINEEMSTL